MSQLLLHVDKDATVVIEGDVTSVSGSVTDNATLRVTGTKGAVSAAGMNLSGNAICFVGNVEPDLVAEALRKREERIRTKK